MQKPCKWGEEAVQVEGAIGLKGLFDVERTGSFGSSTRAADGTCMGTSLKLGFAGVKLGKQALHGRDAWGAGLTQGNWPLPLGLCVPDQLGKILLTCSLGLITDRSSRPDVGP